jgi:hypothetical protein
MANDTDTIEVPLDDAPEPALDRANMRLDQPEPQIEVTDAPEPAKEPRKRKSPDEGIAALKQQLDDERKAKADADRARAVAEARAASAEQTAVSAQKEAGDTRLHLINTSILSVTQTLDAAESAYAAALATGDHAQAAKINRQMTQESAKLAQLEATKQHIETAPPPRVPQADDPAERFARTLAPKAAAWVRAHPEYVRDKKLNTKLTAAHNLALADDLAEGTDEYFEAIETTLRLRQPQGEPTVAIDTAPQRQSGGRQIAAPAAPVSRSGTGNGGSANSVRLSPQQYADAKEGAQIAGISLQEYLRQKAAIDRENLH